MQFVLAKNKVVTSTLGHAIEFKKGELTYVPREMWDAVQAVGAIPENELPDDFKPAVVAPDSAHEREDLIMKTIDEMVQDGRREYFTAAGAPHAKVMTTMLGFTVEAKERDDVWLKYNTKED